jgi:hypothetical protein
MIEAKLLVGRYLQFTPGASRHLPAGAHVPAFVNVVCPPLTVQESTRRDPGARFNPFRNVGGQRESAVVAGTNPNKTHRNFKWLPWYAGDIAETPLTCDVLTGPMSGCILVSYRRAGVPLAGHIGTVTVTDAIPVAVNNSVKAVWNNFANAHPGDVVGGFNPVDATVPVHPPAQPGDVGGQTWGLLTTNGLFYAVQVWVQVGTANNFRVAAVHQVPSMTLAQLQNI